MGTTNPLAGRDGSALTTMAEVLFGERPLLPTHAKMYARAMLGSQTSPTAEDFTEAELDAIRLLAGGYGDPKNVTYGSYGRPTPGDPAPPQVWDLFDRPQRDAALAEFVVKNAPPGADTPMGTIFHTLGQFRADETPEGDLRVRDVYNFNDDDSQYNELTHNNGLWPVTRDMLKGKASLYDVARSLGRVFGPDGSNVPGQDNQGMPIDFTIPREYSWHAKKKEEQAIVDALLGGS